MVAGERWGVVLTGMDFAAGAHRRCSSWDVRVRQSKARDLPQGS